MLGEHADPQPARPGTGTACTEIGAPNDANVVPLVEVQVVIVLVGVVVDEAHPDVVAGGAQRARVGPRHRRRRQDDRRVVGRQHPLRPLARLVAGRVRVGVALVLDRRLEQVVRVELVDQRQAGRLAVGVDGRVRDLRGRDPRAARHGLQQRLGGAVVVYRSPCSIGIVSWPPPTVGGLPADRVDDLPLGVERRAVELIRLRRAGPAAAGEVDRERDRPARVSTLPALVARAELDRVVPSPPTVNSVTNGEALPRVVATRPRAAVDAVLGPLDAGAAGAVGRRAA